MNHHSNTTLSLEFHITCIIVASKKALINSEIRTELHRLNVTCTKIDVNRTLQKMKDSNILQFRQIENYKYWSLVPGNIITIGVTTQSLSRTSPNTHFDPRRYINNNNNSNNNNNNNGLISMNHPAIVSYIADDSYRKLLDKIRDSGLDWMRAGRTNVLPTKTEKIKRFISNCLYDGLNPELVDRITDDILEYGWEPTL